MKVGDYVRYKKLIYHNQGVDDIRISKIKDNGEYEDRIIKSSPNIIDLIEVGDIITTNNLCGEITKIDDDKIYTTCYDGEYCSASDIKSIVTKEQFESMEYKVGE